MSFRLVTQRLPALQSRNFRLLWIGQGISIVGSQMQFWAINWHIYALTHSPLALGLVGLFRVVPIIVFSFIGGAVADAIERRRIMLITQSMAACLALTLAGLTYKGVITPISIYILSAALSGTFAFDNPARQSLIPNLVPPEHFPNAVSLNSLMFQFGTIIGPLLTGLLIAHGNISATYFVNAFSFLAVIAALLAMRPQETPKKEGLFVDEKSFADEERSKVNLAALKEGIEFLLSTPILIWTMLLDFLATFFSSANALLPIFATTILKVGAKGYGYLAAAPAIGSITAGFIMVLLPTIRRQGWTVIISVFLYGLATVLFGFSTVFWLSWFFLAAAGAADTVSTVLRQTIRQLVTPDRLRGRTTAVNMIFFMGGPQLGELEAGVVANWIGARWSVITGGLGCVLTVLLVAARAKGLREYTHDQNQNAVRRS